MIGAIFNILGRLPLKAGYVIADALSFIAERLVRYRRKVILDNLRTSFPDKSDREIRKICHDFYRFLADYFIETIRLGKMSADEIKRRMTFENPELIDELTRQGISVAFVLGHYCNWEWLSSLPLHLKGYAVPSQIYHPLENADADRAFARIRSRFGCRNIPMRDTLRYLAAKHSEGITTATGFIADQSPLYASTHLWLDFLNHETGVFTGPEKIMRRYRGAMVYCHVERPRRGYYHCRFELICDDVSAVPEFEPTRTYFRKLEAQIVTTPHLWLWSHRRWKRPRLRD